MKKSIFAVLSCVALVTNALGANNDSQITIGSQGNPVAPNEQLQPSGANNVVVNSVNQTGGGNPTIARPPSVVERPPQAIKVESLHKLLKGDPADLLGKNNDYTKISIFLDKPFKTATSVKLKCSEGMQLPASVTFPAGMTSVTVNGTVVMLTPPRKVEIDVTVLGRTFRKVLVCNIRPNVSGVAATDRTGFFGNGFPPPKKK